LTLRYGSGDESVKPNNTDGHGYDFQAVDIDPSLRASPSQAAVVVDDSRAAYYYPPGNGTRGNSSLPHTSGLRAALQTVHLCLLKRPSKAAAGLDDSRVAIRTHIGNAITFSGPASVSSVDS
jgi:hypothetical protein